MISMAWENTLLASRILPPAYTPVEVATNRSQDASLMLDQDGRLTLLIILTTSAGLAIVLLFFIFLRIGCLRGQSCFGRYKDRHDRSACPLTTVVLDDHAAITKSLATSPQTIQATFIQTRNEPPSDSYTIKLVDNDLIVETQINIPFFSKSYFFFHMNHTEMRAQLSSGSEEQATATSTAMETMTPTAMLKMSNPPGEAFSQQHQQRDNNVSQQLKLSSSGEAGEVQSGFLLFKTWLSGRKSKDLPTENGTAYISSLAREDAQLQQQQMATPLETKSLCGSPKRRYGRPLANGETMATQKQQIMARFGQHLPGFGFTQSKSSCLFEDEDDEEYELDEISSVPAVTYSYRNGNQFEYMGGPYGYVDPLYSHQLPGNNNQHPTREIKSFVNERNRTSFRLEELDIVVQRADQRHSTLESRREPQPPVLLLLPTLVRSADSLVLPTK
ncbi:Uncharacterized protein APZ42_027215 [Daphnia magna]|uniref:Uncharacterized protein n=1 Tax=Daphnia magna TaxID=35525 RepID=A0A164RD05_9CRUS|nr:Uncharacterized protein APZ42_027215 [Daphnia magna]